MPFPAGMGGTPLSGAPRFRLKRSDHRKAGSSGPRLAAARNQSSPAEIPFPIGGGSALRSIRPPGNALSCRGGGDAPVWSAPFPAQALRSSEGWIFRPTVSSSAKQSLSSRNPLSHRGMVPHCGAFVHPEMPFPAGVKGTPLSGAPRFRLKRSDHRKAGSSGPRSAAARSKPTQWRSPRYWTSRRTCRSPCSSQSKYIRHLQPS